MFRYWTHMWVMNTSINQSINPQHVVDECITIHIAHSTERNQLQGATKWDEIDDPLCVGEAKGIYDAVQESFYYVFNFLGGRPSPSPGAEIFNP